jgi:hypothetical protein
MFATNQFFPTLFQLLYPLADDLRIWPYITPDIPQGPYQALLAYNVTHIILFVYPNLPYRSYPTDHRGIMRHRSTVLCTTPQVHKPNPASIFPFGKLEL